MAKEKGAEFFRYRAGGAYKHLAARNVSQVKIYILENEYDIVSAAASIERVERGDVVNTMFYETFLIFGDLEQGAYYLGRLIKK